MFMNSVFCFSVTELQGTATFRGDFREKILIKTEIEAWILKVNKSSEKLAKGDKERLLLFAFINYKCIDYRKSTCISR